MRRIATAGLIVALAALAWLAAGESRSHVVAIGFDGAALLRFMRDLAARVHAEVGAAYARSPEMALGLALALLLPALSLTALIVRRFTIAAPNPPEPIRPAGVHPKARAWLAVADGGRERDVEVAGELLRIGGDRDNDLVLAGRNVAQFHALIRRTPEAEFVIIDVSGAQAGVAVNGARLTSAPLKGGDCIAMGDVALTFHREVRTARGGVAPARGSATS